MIINKQTRLFLTRSDKPNENWTNEDCYIVDDNSELASKIISNYPNIEYVIEDNEIEDVNITEPKPVILTHEEINALVVDKIREKYDVNEEFKMINLGISDPENTKYIAYRDYVNECIAYGDELEASQSSK